MGEHRLVPCDAQLELRVGEPDPHQHVHHPRPIVVVRDGGQELVKRLDRHGFTLGCQRADQPRIALCLSTLHKTKGAARGVPRAAASSLTLSPCAWSSKSGCLGSSGGCNGSW